MNPILLKPSSDIGSQVIVNGEVRGSMPAKEYFRHKRALIPDILQAYNSLAEEFDIIVIEGAGSPAEINLKADDIVNMGLAKLVDAPVLLAGDIDRGGVFAQLYGTVELLEPEERARIQGLVINKFRGRRGNFAPRLVDAGRKDTLPVVGVVPYLKVDIEDEDSLRPPTAENAVKPLDVAILRLPHISKLYRFYAAGTAPPAGRAHVQTTRELGAPDLVILPGTKNTVDDLLWLRQSGLEATVQKLAAGGTPVLGVCGGYQMLGKRWMIPLAPRAAIPRLCAAWACCRPGRFSPTKTPHSIHSHNRRPLQGRNSPATRSTPAVHLYRSRAHPLHPGGRHARGLRAGQCVRHLPARPV